MWFNMKAKMESAQKAAEKYAARVNELDVEVTSLRNEMISLRKKLEQEDAIEQNLSVAIDFNKIDAFSVERNIGDNNRRCTVIGYLQPSKTTADGVVTKISTTQEWVLYCSAEQHEKLVKEFEGSK
jgi:hypothetical protein